MILLLVLIQAKILGNYNDILKACDALDYHDLISCSVTLLSDFPEGETTKFSGFKVYDAQDFLVFTPIC